MLLPAFEYADEPEPDGHGGLLQGLHARGLPEDQDQEPALWGGAGADGQGGRMRIGRRRAAQEGRRVRVYEVGVAYAGRTYEEGKKIGWKDAVSAIVQIIRFRFSD